MKINTDEKLINDLLTRGVENVYPTRQFLESQLKSGKQLKLYLGIDPTGPSLHMGHAIPMMKLKQFQELGHKVVLLIGSFTAMIGDPTDKMATRQPLTRKQVLQNCKNYKKQAAKILNISKVEYEFNHKWLDRLDFRKVIDIASNLTVQQLLERDMFDKRMYGAIECPGCGFLNNAKRDVEFCKDGDVGYRGDSLSHEYKCSNCKRKYGLTECKLQKPSPIYLNEFLYPLLQAYDSVAMDVDGELGGNDQTFNMLVGRDLMKKMMKKEKFVLTMKLLSDPTGKKMGKSEGNMITLEDSATDMFGKVMSWTDEMIVSGFELCTFMPQEKVEEAKKRLASGENPRDLKLELAESVVKVYHGEEAGKQARENFISMFQKKETPDEIKEFDLNGKNIIEALTASGLTASNGEARRLIEQKGVKLNDAAVESTETIVKSGDVIKKGKRFFIKIK